jgi:hypothetical protein
MGGNSNDVTTDTSGQEQQAAGGEQEHAGASGEGAASALAQLKTQTRQHRRQSGDSDEASGGNMQ